MAQDWAKSFYRSPAWLKNRSSYMRTLVDLHGRRVFEKRDESTGDTRFFVDDHGYLVEVKSSHVVPEGLCERCYQRGEITPAKVVHHIVWLTPQNIDDPHITLSYDNFQRLCQDCHAAVHHPEGEMRVTFDENGNVVWKDGR